MRASPNFVTMEDALMDRRAFLCLPAIMKIRQRDYRMAARGFQSRSRYRR